VPVKLAVMVCEPTTKVVDEAAATPFVTVTPEAIVFAPSRNVTVPVGVPDDEETVAVNVTD
jgi:hypothetical protein